MDAIETLINDYYELNGAYVEELPGRLPLPHEFMRFVARNTPFVVRRGARDWPAVQTWSVPVLRRLLGGLSVNVAVTPNGLADAPTPLDQQGGADAETVFAKPHEEDQPFGVFLDHVVRQEQTDDDDMETRYAQTQNDNLRGEYATVFPHVPTDIAFATAALDRAPEAINLWIGNAHSTTALHRDNYENVYVQVLGRKTFALLPPLCQPCVHEKPLAPYTYERDADGDGFRLVKDTPTGDGDGDVPFALWDPDRPHDNATRYSHLAQVLRVTLEPGDMLYLPAMWYHKVTQTASDEGVCVAVNYWYDMDFTGPLVPMAAFVKAVYQAECQRGSDTIE